jgi:hypothetical protein
MENAPAAAAQIMITVIPIVGIFMGSVVVFFYLLWNHKERVLMIEKGIQPRSWFNLEVFSLLGGILNLGIGVALLVFFLVKEGMSYCLLGGIIPLSVGASLIVFFIVKRTVMSR